MALKPKSVSRNGTNGTGKVPTKFTVKTSQAGNLEQLKRDAARTPSKVIRLRDKESVTIRFLEEPPEWTKYYEHGVQRNGFWSRVPCHSACQLDGNSAARAATRWLTNVVDVGTGEVRLLYLTKSMVDSFIIKYERSRGRNSEREPTLTNRNYTIVRIGSDQDTKYEIDPEELGQLEIDGKRVKLSSFEKLSVVDELTQEVENYYGANVRSAPKTGDDDDDEVEDEDEEDEDELEDSAEEDEEEEEDEDDEEADDEEEDEEDEEEEEEPVRRVVRKPLPTAAKRTAKPVAKTPVRARR